MDNQNNQSLESDSLETSEVQTGVISSPSTGSTEPIASPTLATPGSEPPKQNKPSRLNALKRINTYYLLLVAVLLLLGGITYFAIQNNKKNETNDVLDVQELSSEALRQLGNADATVGDPKQTLSVESNTIFAGKVLIRGSLDVAGGLNIGGPLSLTGLTAGGTTSVEVLQAKSFTVSGDAAVQGKLNILSNLTVNGNGTFSGALSASKLSVDTLQLNKDLQLNRHIDAGGGTPGRSNGSALGGGGTSSVSGTDTAGTVSINSGTSAPAGCFITVNFSVAFNAIPHVVISPSSSPAAALDYYTNRSTNSFSICTASDPPDNTAGMNFDYIVID